MPFSTTIVLLPPFPVQKGRKKLKPSRNPCSSPGEAQRSFFPLPMANPVLQNPIVVEVINEFGDFLADPNEVQEVIDVVRAELAETAAAYVEAQSQLALARRHLADAIHDAAARLALPGGELPEVSDLDADPEFAARAAAYLGLAEYVENIVRVRGVLLQALGFLVALRALAFATARARLVPGILLTAAAAYAVAYVASGGTVVPGTASLLRIFVIVLCFLFGFWG